MKLIITSLTALLLSSQAFAQDGAELSIDLKYGNAVPIKGTDNFSEAVMAIQYDTSAVSAQTYFAADLAMQYVKDEKFGLLALHYGWQGELAHFGGVAGLSSGDVNGKFLGLEWGYTGDQFKFDIRASHWRLDGVPSNMNRIDARAEYKIWNGVGVYYDYTRQFATKDGFKGDEFLAGLNYEFTNGHKLELGVGNVHPKDILTLSSRVWTQYAISYKINLGGKGRIDPVDLPVFYDF